MTQHTDLDILYNDPVLLLDKYRHLVDKIIDFYVEQGVFIESDYDSLLIEIQHRLPSQLKSLCKKNEQIAIIKTLLVKAIDNICKNYEDQLLLASQSPRLILKYTENLAFRVHSFVKTNQIKSSDVDDVVQTVKEKLLLKLQKGQLSSYKGEALFSTFIYRVIGNVIKDAVKAFHTQKATITRNEIIVEPPTSDSLFKVVSNQIDMQYVLHSFKELMQLFSQLDQRKLEICMKVHFCLILNEKDAALLDLEGDDLSDFIKIFGINYAPLNEGAKWEHLNVFINNFENKLTSSNNLWKWFSRQKARFIAKLLYMHYLSQERISLVKKLNTEEKLLLTKISEKPVNKYADEWFGGVIYHFFEKK